MLLPRKVLYVVLAFCVAVWLLTNNQAEEVLTAAPHRLAEPADELSGKQTTEQAVRKAVDLCNRDNKNNKNGHVSCILIRNAVVTSSAVHAPEVDNSNLPRQFPPLGASRHHMRPIRFSSEASNLDCEAVEVGHFQSPVIGAHWENAWHTIADFFVMLFHTLQPVLRENIRVVWFTRTGRGQLNKGCSTGPECRQQTLFDPFARFFSPANIKFVEDGAPPVRVKYLIVGLNTRCSPIPTEDVGTAECQKNLRELRDKLLEVYDIPLQRNASKVCPSVHFMSRQGDRYRHITPFDDLQLQLKRKYGDAFPGCTGGVRVLKITSRMSFRDQLLSIYNNSVLVAGRGGGTALSIFLPSGGLYVSLSGFDRWSPYRDLVPAWITLRHVEVDLVHHEDWRKPPQWFGSGKNRYIDPNRAAYRVDPVPVSSRIVENIVQWAK